MRRFKRVLNGTSAAVLMLSSLISMGFTGVAHATGTAELNKRVPVYAALQ